ncbi:g8960 [Coccomyxa elongata]
MPSAVLVDACDAESAAVRHAFDFKVAVFLCHWHVQKAWKKQLWAKALLHLGASKNQLLRYLGTLDGAVGGGFKGLQSAMGDSLDTVGSSGGGGGQTVASDAMPEELAELSINDVEQDGTSDPADSSAECALAEPSAKVERALAGTDSFEDVSGSELVPNADAWEGPRRKDFVEIATDKRKHRQRLAANAAVRAAARAAATQMRGASQA